MTRPIDQQDQKVEITYDVQWSDYGDDDNCFGPLTQEDLRTFLTAQFYAGGDVVVTKCCGALQVGRGRYHKHGDGTFSVICESLLIVGLMQVLELTQRMVVPSSQMLEVATGKQGLRFTKEFLCSVLEEAGGPTQVTELKEEGETRTFIYSRALNGHWYHLTHNGRCINFPKPQDALDLIVALQCYALEQSGQV